MLIIMKNIISYFIVLSILIFSCKKESDSKSHVIVGKLYRPLTHMVVTNLGSTILVNDKIVKLNKIESYMSTNSIYQSVFSINFFDSTWNSKIQSIQFDLYTSKLKAEDFFQNDIYHIDTVQLFHGYNSNNSFGDYFTDANIDFKWDSVVLENGIFRGKGYLKLNFI